MPIPDLDARGLLPPGLYPCSLEELHTRFHENLAFFAQVKDQPEVTKGLLRVEL